MGLIGLGGTVRWVTAIVINREVGLDPSDESWYLISALRPSEYVAQPSNFGHHLAFLRSVTGGSISNLRVAGVVILLLATLAAALGLSRYFTNMRPKAGRQLFLVLWAVLSAISLTQYSLWLTTPGYNLLALAYTLLFLGGLLRGIHQITTGAEGTSPVNFGLVLATAAGVLLTDVKGPAGLTMGLLALAVIWCISRWHQFKRSLLSLAIGAGIGLSTSLLLPGSPVRALSGVHRYSQMASRGGIYNLELLVQPGYLLATMLPLAVAILIVGAAWRNLAKRISVGGVARDLAPGLAMLAVTVALWRTRPLGGSTSWADGGWWWIYMAAWALLFTSLAAQHWDRRLFVGPLVAGSALAAAFGSNNGVVQQTALYAGLLAVGVVLQTATVLQRGEVSVLVGLPGLVFIAAACLTSYLQVGSALHDPYRLEGGIEQAMSRVDLGEFGTLRVHEGLASYLRALEAAGEQIPEQAKDCLLDLAGGTPISALALGARSATTAWMLGGYEDSDAAVDFLLTFATCTEGPTLVIEADDSPLGMRLPDVLVDRRRHSVATVEFHGYVQQRQHIVVLEESAGPTTTSGTRPRRAVDGP